MEDKVIQHSFIFKISDKMTAQIKKPVTHKALQHTAGYRRMEMNSLAALYLRNLIMKKKYVKIRNGCWQAFLQMKQSLERKWTNGKDFRK